MYAIEIHSDRFGWQILCDREGRDRLFSSAGEAGDYARYNTRAYPYRIIRLTYQGSGRCGVTG